MKKTLYVLVFITFITTVGCHNDKDSPNTNVEQLMIGKWRNNTTTSMYYKGGAEVYRESASVAITPPDKYTEFRANNVYADFVLNGSAYTETDGTYSLSNNYTTLHISVKGQSVDFPFYYQDNSNISITTSVTGGVTYIKDKVSYNADSVTTTTYLVRL